jgi:hypothetical protein
MSGGERRGWAILGFVNKLLVFWAEPSILWVTLIPTNGFEAFFMLQRMLWMCWACASFSITLSRL